ncbi:unnamed protein product [Adineta ricciae]|uniref:Uncharacterized protein n=1 Tax=Adineta ricciae TaxID=249248 RepID=A0A814SJE8_ADIRI|nr:unnamed protein product [Adineta ricciae]
MVFNDQKGTMDKIDDEIHYPSISSVGEVTRTRKILLLLISFQLVLTLICSIATLYTYIFGLSLTFQSFIPIILFLLFFTCLIYIVGLVAVDRYIANSIFVFIKLMIIDLILVYLTIGLCFILPLCKEKYTTGGIIPAMIIAISYLMVFSGISFLPAFTIRYSQKLAELLTGSDYVAGK